MRSLSPYQYLTQITNNPTQLQTKAVLSQGKPRDAAVNFGMYQSLLRHRAVSLLQHSFLVQAYSSDRSNAEITQSTPIFTAS